MFFGLCSAYTQNANPVDFYFEKDSISVNQGESFINFIVLRNSSNSDATIEKVIPVKAYPGLLLSPKKSFKLAAGETKRIPIKFLVNIDFMKMKADVISYNLSYNINSETNTASATFNIHRNEERHIALYSFKRENYLSPSQTETSISMYVENRGYSQRSIKLSFLSVPDGVKINPREIILNLDGREKREVSFQVSLKPQGNFYPDYNINVKATDLLDNENVGSTYLKLIILSSNRQIVQGSGAEMGSNFFETAYSQQSNGLQTLRLRGNSTFNLGNSWHGTFNLSTDYYTSEGLYNINNTWFELQGENTLYRIGNINAMDYDYATTGRGGLFNTKVGTNKSVEVFALENNYNLYGTYFPEDKGSKIAGAKFSLKNSKNHSSMVSYIYDDNPRLNTDTHVAHTFSAFTLDSIHKFSVETGLSLERGKINGDKNLGFSAGLNYHFVNGKWTFQSLNDFGSRAYAGLSRGSLNFSQNLSYNLTNFGRLFLQYQNTQAQPEYLSFQESSVTVSPSEYPYYFYSTQRIQTGVQFAVANWSFLLSPQIEKQKNTSNLFSNELLAYKIHSKIGARFGVHNINLSSEYSYSSLIGADWFSSLRTDLSYRVGSFSLNGAVQINPNSITELNNYIPGTDDFINYSGYASYNFQTLNNTFSGSVSAVINYSDQFKNTNKSVHGDFEYEFLKNWSATSYFNLTTYKSSGNLGFKGENYQVRVGLKKYFVKATEAGNHSINLQLFHDTNFNNYFDSDEEAMANIPVYLNDYVAITDAKGKVQFSNVPKGTYTVRVAETGDLRLLMDSEIVITKNIKANFGLVKKNIVVGKLVELKQQYDNLETSVRGVIVYAKDSNGKIVSTVVDQNDTFQLFLDNGTFTIYIQNTKYNYINASQKITLRNESKPKTLTFEYKKKNREIKVKKF